MFRDQFHHVFLYNECCLLHSDAKYEQWRILTFIDVYVAGESSARRLSHMPANLALGLRTKAFTGVAKHAEIYALDSSNCRHRVFESPLRSPDQTRVDQHDQKPSL